MVRRGEERQQAILDATIAMLSEGSYEALTIDAVAAAAKASKTTIYRRWSGKAELVRAAIEHYQDQHRAPHADTGSLRTDLVSLLRAARDHTTGEFLAMMGGLMQAMRTDEELRRILWSRLVDEPGPFVKIVEHAVRRGEVHPTTSADLVHEVTEAIILRQTSLDLPWDDEFIRHAVDDILLPLLARPAAVAVAPPDEVADPSDATVSRSAA